LASCSPHCCRPATQRNRCETVVNPSIQIGVPNGDGSYRLSDVSYRVWADSGNVNKNAKAFCFQKYTFLNNLYLSNYTYGCAGVHDTTYADHNASYAPSAIASFFGRKSGSSTTACYNLFTTIRCCWTTYNWCFAPHATANVRHQGPTRMEDLVIGDHVQVGPGDTYEPIYSFAHRSTGPATFLKMETNQGAIEITEDHMLFVHDKATPILARDVKIGDLLVTSTDPAKVQDIQTEMRQGYYAPLTYSGLIMVNGFQASTYGKLSGDTVQEKLALPFSMQTWYSMLQAPHRIVCKINFDLCRNETYDEQGWTNLLKYPESLYRWWLDQSVWFALLSLPFVYLVFGFLVTLEVTVIDQPKFAFASLFAIILLTRCSMMARNKLHHKSL
jgi:Hint module